MSEELPWEVLFDSLGQLGRTIVGDDPVIYAFLLSAR